MLSKYGIDVQKADYSGNLNDGVKAVDDAIDYISQHSPSAEIVNDFIESGKKIILTESVDSGYRSVMNPITGLYEDVIIFNPNYGYENYDEKGEVNGILSPVSVLLHEMYMVNSDRCH